MDWMTILAQLFELVIFPLLAIGTIYLINLIINFSIFYASFKLIAVFINITIGFKLCISS